MEVGRTSPPKTVKPQLMIRILLFILISLSAWSFPPESSGQYNNHRNRQAQAAASQPRASQARAAQARAAQARQASQRSRNAAIQRQQVQQRQTRQQQIQQKIVRQQQNRQRLQQQQRVRQTQVRQQQIRQQQVRQKQVRQQTIQTQVKQNKLRQKQIQQSNIQRQQRRDYATRVQSEQTAGRLNHQNRIKAQAMSSVARRQLNQKKQRLKVVSSLRSKQKPFVRQILPSNNSLVGNIATKTAERQRLTPFKKNVARGLSRPSISNRTKSAATRKVFQLASASKNTSKAPLTNAKTETIQRWMSKAELQATRETGLLRGGKEGTHFVTNAANRSAKNARQRLALPQTPEVRVTMEVPAGVLSKSSDVKPAFNMSGGGKERTAAGKVPVVIKKVDGKQ